MQRKTQHILAGVLVAGAMVILVAAAATGQTPDQATRTDNQGGITVKAIYVTSAYLKATPTNPLAGKVDLKRNVVFAVTLDTHSGDLSGYDFVKNVTLRNDRGQQLTPVGWVATADGSHHRAGGLLFPRTNQAGRAIDSQARVLELVVRGLGGVTERVLRWTLPLE
jgi:hypothetical protein